MGLDYLAGFVSGQWTAAETLMNKINSFVGPLRRKDMYRILMEFRPKMPCEDRDNLGLNL